jgi:uncharacterized membrane protein YqjE
VNAGTAGGPARSLRAALGNLGASVLGLVHTRLELAALEFEEERHRAVERVALLLVAILFFAFALLVGSLIVVAYYWEEHRLPALIGVTLAYLAVGFLALWRVHRIGQVVTKPFAGSLAELERDRQWLSSELGTKE